MAQIKKFALIPEELVTKHTVSNKRLSELDKAMMKILHSDLPDSEKLIFYHELLKKSLNLQEFNQPMKENKVQSTSEHEQNNTSENQPQLTSENKSRQEVKVEDNNYQGLILASLSKSMRRKAENALTIMQNQPDIISWSKNGEILSHGENIPNTNIIDFFQYLYNSRKVLPHKGIYDTMLKDLNIPKQFIGNKNLLKLPVQRKMKRIVKPPKKWELYSIK